MQNIISDLIGVTLGEASLIELVLAVVTGLAFYNTLNVLGSRLFNHGANVYFPWSEVLGPATAFVVSGGLLLLVVSRRGTNEAGIQPEHP